MDDQEYYRELESAYLEDSLYSEIDELKEEIKLLKVNQSFIDKEKEDLLKEAIELIVFVNDWIEVCEPYSRIKPKTEEFLSRIKSR